MNFFESMKLALDSVRVNKLRAFLTLLSIAIGVFAIMGAGTLTSSLESAVSGELAKIGETTFWLERMPKIHTGNTFWKYRKRKPITYSQFNEVKKQMTLTDDITAYGFTQGMTVKYGNQSSNPDVTLIGTDDKYFPIFAVNTDQGRPLNFDDINLNRKVCVIGNDVVKKLFDNTDPIGKIINIKTQNYYIIGILEVKGAILGQSKDNQIIIPISNFLQYYADEWEESLTIAFKAKSKELISSTIDEAIGCMRTIRKVEPWEENSFELETNESISQQFGGFVAFLSAIGWISGGFALIAAGVGIMNIMLVSVKERTREIGIRKAIGARKSWILKQFIIETITLCQIGCLIGIGAGIGSAALLGKLISINVIFPVYWVVFSIIICTILGLVFGAYPAWKAANLDPIDALRYE